MYDTAPPELNNLVGNALELAGPLLTRSPSLRRGPRRFVQAIGRSCPRLDVVPVPHRVASSAPNRLRKPLVAGELTNPLTAQAEPASDLSCGNQFATAC